jgi:hypothetical protein
MSLRVKFETLLIMVCNLSLQYLRTSILIYNILYQMFNA